jgi:hypothetical protein
VTTDADKALASWFWRNTHFAHGEEGAEDWWGAALAKGATSGRANTGRDSSRTDSRSAARLIRNGPRNSRHCSATDGGRGVGVSGHNSFEAFLTGGPYGEGRWALIDHDLSTVIFDPEGKRLLSLKEVQADWRRLINRTWQPQKQNGWLVCGLDAGDGGVYQSYNTAEYLAGYAGPPPIVSLRRGESLRRYFAPGLEDGKKFVFWGRNYHTANIPGPERSRTWVNQPEKMYGSTTGTTHVDGQVRYGNAVYTYEPDFSDGSYREGVVDESEHNVTFEFYTPYIIGAAPRTDGPWGIYEPGCTEGLVLHGTANCPVSLSVDQGRTWSAPDAFTDGLDLTDLAKGHRQYFLRFHASATALRQSGLKIVTFCQGNPAIFPRLKDGGTIVNFADSQRAVVSAGPNREQARAHLVAGDFNKPTLTLELATPRGEPAIAIYAAAHIASSNPPDPNIHYQIEYSIDSGRSWQPIVKDWNIPRRGEEPQDFWSQSLCYGSLQLPEPLAEKVQVRFRNDGGKPVIRAEAHLLYRTAVRDSTKVTYAWRDDSGERKEANIFSPTERAFHGECPPVMM